MTPGQRHRLAERFLAEAARLRLEAARALRQRDHARARALRRTAYRARLAALDLGSPMGG